MTDKEKEDLYIRLGADPSKFDGGVIRPDKVFNKAHPMLHVDGLFQRLYEGDFAIIGSKYNELKVGMITELYYASKTNWSRPRFKARYIASLETGIRRLRNVAGPTRHSVGGSIGDIHACEIIKIPRLAIHPMLAEILEDPEAMKNVTFNEILENIFDFNL